MKGKRTDLGGANCAIARSLQVVGDWWSLLIVRDAFLGMQRFGEFQKSIGLAKNILSSRLKKLVDEEIFRIEHGDNSSSVHRYVLTERGERLGVVLVALWQWGEENCFQPGEFGAVLVDQASGQPLAKLEITTIDGQVLGPHEFRMAVKDKEGSMQHKQAVS
jgi:DNA-binding HxlR family transcriptional regulator